MKKSNVENLKQLLISKFTDLSENFEPEYSPEDNILSLLDELEKLGYNVELKNYYAESWTVDDDRQYVDDHDVQVVIDGVLFLSKMSASQDDDEYLTLRFTPFMTESEVKESEICVVLDQMVLGKNVKIMSDGTCRVEDDHYFNLEYLVKSFLKK